jgi:predicted DNA-binding transcriptional regulator AlpA|tara:strand:+ start:235 stop:375 length:141 start_codon:yes stop_codon:yes gene_type:complete
MNLVWLSKSYTYHLAAQGKFPKNMPLVSGGTSVRMMSLRLLIVIKA